MVNEKMTAIADAIRSKTGGTKKLGLDAMASSIEDVYDKGYDEGVSVYEDDYTNVVLTAQDPSSDQVYNGVGYRNDWRLANGGGYAWSGHVSVGLIDYVVPNSGLPPTIYIKGNISLDGALMTLWKQNKVYVSEINNLSTSTTYFKITEIKNGYYKLVPIAGSNGRSPMVDNIGTGISYISLVLYGTGENIVISLDNPIASAVENAYENGYADGQNDIGETAIQFTEIEAISILNNDTYGYQNNIIIDTKMQDIKKIEIAFKQLTEKANNIVLCSASVKGYPAPPFINYAASSVDMGGFIEFSVISSNVVDGYTVSSMYTNTDSTQYLCFGSWNDATYSNENAFKYLRLYDSNDNLMVDLIPIEFAVNSFAFYDKVNKKIYKASNPLAFAKV